MINLQKIKQIKEPACFQVLVGVAGVVLSGLIAVLGHGGPLLGGSSDRVQMTGELLSAEVLREEKADREKIFVSEKLMEILRNKGE